MQLVQPTDDLQGILTPEFELAKQRMEYFEGLKKCASNRIIYARAW